MITVLHPGLLTTIQDRGRAGWRARGMPQAGAMDADAFAAANLLAGNAPDAAAIELTLLGGTFRFEADAVVGLAGADQQPKLGGVAVAPWCTLRVRAGSTLALAGARAGVRAYLAVRGGIDVPSVLGSRATYTRARVGGLDGRALAKGDVLRVGAGPVVPPTNPGPTADVTHWPLPTPLLPTYAREVRLRAMLGPQDDRFTPEAIEILLRDSFRVTNRNDRMAYVLEGPPLRHLRGPDIVSDGVVPGSVQVPGSGMPIVMMADCATVGGYTKIATVISADLPRLAQARAGDEVRFERCTHDDAVAALRERAAWLDAIRRWAGGLRGDAGGERR